MSTDVNDVVDYFKIIPYEVLLKILLLLTPEERYKLESVGDRRLRKVVISLLTDFDELHLNSMRINVPCSVLKYHNLKRFGDWQRLKSLPALNLDTMDLSESLQTVILDEKKRNDFAFQLSYSCPQIESFAVSYHALDLVQSYCKNLEGKPHVKELSVYVGPILAKDFWEKITRINQMCPNLICIRIKCMRHPLLSDLSKWHEMWSGMRGKIEEVELEFCPEFEYLHKHIVKSLRSLKRLTIDHLNSQELDLVTLNNPNLAFLHINQLFSGYDLIPKFKQLTHLHINWIKQRVSRELFEGVLQSMGHNLIHVSVYLREKSDDLNLLSDYCHKIETLWIYGFTFEEKRDVMTKTANIIRDLPTLTELNVALNGFTPLDVVLMRQLLPSHVERIRFNSF